MELSIKFFLLVLFYFNVYLIQSNVADDDLQFHYDKMEMYNGTDQYFKWNSAISQGQDNVFIVDSVIEVKQDFGNDYKISIELFREENNEYQLFFAMPKLGVCDFMKTFYKKFFYDEISKYSNLPSPDTCPFPKDEYEVKQYPFDMKKYAQYKSLVRPGNYRVQVFLVKDDVALCGALIYGRVTKRS